jgi:hypothetical protein
MPLGICLTVAGHSWHLVGFWWDALCWFMSAQWKYLRRFNSCFNSIVGHRLYMQVAGHGNTRDTRDTSHTSAAPMHSQHPTHPIAARSGCSRIETGCAGTSRPGILDRT